MRLCNTVQRTFVLGFGGGSEDVPVVLEGLGMEFRNVSKYTNEFWSWVGGLSTRRISKY